MYRYIMKIAIAANIIISKKITIIHKLRYNTDSEYFCYMVSNGYSLELWLSTGKSIRGCDCCNCSFIIWNNFEKIS